MDDSGLLETSLDWCNEIAEFSGRETIASLTGSILQGIEDDDEISSNLIFSTISTAEELTTFSTDSLDRLQPLYAVKNDNYTLAFGTPGAGTQMTKGEKERVNLGENRRFNLADNMRTKPTFSRKSRPLSCNDLEALKAKIQDWPSLQLLLPKEYQDMFRTPELYELTNNIQKNLEDFEQFTEFKDPTSELTVTLQKLTSFTAPETITSSHPISLQILRSLCPLLYTLLSDGLKPQIQTLFGPVHNSVWRLVESSIQFGPTTVRLQELLMKISSEDMLVEGPMKFNAFVAGLLSLQLLPSWFTFLRTKERLLRTHYTSSGFMYNCNTTTRVNYDSVLANLALLQSKARFQLDIFYEAKELYGGFGSSVKFESEKINVLDIHVEKKCKGPEERSTLVCQDQKNSKKFANCREKTANSNKTRKVAFDKNYVSLKNSKEKADATKAFQHKSQMKRSASDDRPLKKLGYDEKGMLETRLEDKFNKLRLQWEQFSGSRIPRLVSAKKK